MFKIRKIKDNEIDKLIEIFDIEKKYLLNNQKSTMVLIEENKYKAIGTYKTVDEMTAIIDHLSMNQVFIDPNYKDIMFRSILNSGLMNGKMYFYLLEDEFFKQYNFKEINEKKLKDINEKFNKNAKVGYKVNVDEFLNRPCNA